MPGFDFGQLLTNPLFNTGINLLGANYEGGNPYQAILQGLGQTAQNRAQYEQTQQAARAEEARQRLLQGAFGGAFPGVSGSAGPPSGVQPAMSPVGGGDGGPSSPMLPGSAVGPPPGTGGGALDQTTAIGLYLLQSDSPAAQAAGGKILADHFKGEKTSRREQRFLDSLQSSPDLTDRQKRILSALPYSEGVKALGELATPSEQFDLVMGSDLGLEGELAERPYKRNRSSGEVSAIGGVGTTVNVGGNEAAKRDQAVIDENLELASSAEEVLGTLDRMATINDAAASGVIGGAGLTQGIAKGAREIFGGPGESAFGLDLGESGASEEFSSLSAGLQILSTGKFKGSLSDRELALAGRTVPKLNDTPEGRHDKLNTLARIAQKARDRARYIAENATDLGRAEATRRAFEAFPSLEERERDFDSLIEGLAGQGYDANDPLGIR